MTGEALGPLMLFLSELVVAIREGLARRRQSQATAVQPSAEAIDAHIRELIAEALARSGDKSAITPPAGKLGPQVADALEAHADIIKLHLDAIRAEHLAHEHRQSTSAHDSAAAQRDPQPVPPPAGSGPPGPAAGGSGELPSTS